MSAPTQEISISQCRDSGLALVLISLILNLATSWKFFLLAAIAVLLITMTSPGLFKPFARFWFGLSHALGTVVSKILLTILFYGLVTPVGLFRRMLGKDAMQLKGWKTGSGSVFHDRDHQFGRKDLEHPY